MDTLPVPSSLFPQVHIWSLDGLRPGDGFDGVPRSSVKRIACVVAGETHQATFKERATVSCSSILEPIPERLDAYGLHDHFTVGNSKLVTTVSLQDLAEKHGVHAWHFIKTDLEGLDFAVIQGLGEHLAYADPSNGVNCALFQGEPRFDEVASYLHELGFELFDLRCERWRFRTSNSRRHRRGHFGILQCVLREPGDSCDSPCGMAGDGAYPSDPGLLELRRTRARNNAVNIGNTSRSGAFLLVARERKNGRVLAFSGLSACCLDGRPLKRGDRRKEIQVT